MKIYRLAIFCIALQMCSMISLSAHALFVDTQPTGKPGVDQEVTVFYAEPADGIKEAISEWWADVSEFTLWLHLPDGTKLQLDVTAQGDHFTASFTPDTPGVYFLSVSHAVKQLAGTTQYVFNASAQVIVGKIADISSLEPITTDQMILVENVHRLKHKRQVAIHSYYNKSPLAHSSLSIFSPDGWVKSIQTQSEGKAFFIPKWKGKYFIESIHKEKVTDQPHKEVIQIYTTPLVVR